MLMHIRFGRVVLGVILVGLVLLVTGNAWATLTADLSYNDMQNGVDVTLHDEGNPLNNPLGTTAGQMEVSISGGPDYWNGDFDAFCVETGQYAETESLGYTLTPITFGSPYDEAAWLFDQGSAGNYSPHWTQLAIWETLEETDTSYNINEIDGNNNVFYATDNNDNSFDASNDANTLLTNLGSADLEKNFNYTGYYWASYYDETNPEIGQDYIIYNPNTAPVPEPGTMFLLGAGLLGMVSVGRRKFVKNH